jgi:hypothetical protein
VVFVYGTINQQISLSKKREVRFSTTKQTVIFIRAVSAYR